MSVMRCDRCERQIDTDFNTEGEFFHGEYLCGDCLVEDSEWNEEDDAVRTD